MCLTETKADAMDIKSTSGDFDRSPVTSSGLVSGFGSDFCAAGATPLSATASKKPFDDCLAVP
jgi:hypothetical protein